MGLSRQAVSEIIRDFDSDRQTENSIKSQYSKIRYKIQTGLAHDLNPNLDGTKSVVF